MIARVQDTTAGFIIVIPREYVEAWGVRQDFALEVHRVGSSHERDEPSAIRALNEEIQESFQQTLPRHAAAYRELAKGPEGFGPHEDILA